jgi:hypothetical protein
MRQLKLKQPEKISAINWPRTGWWLYLYSCGTSEVVNPKGEVTCLYAWESPTLLDLPKFIQTAIAEQRRES